MDIAFPHIIENCVGEKVIFQEIQKTEGGERLTGEIFVEPGGGPIMHTHWLQDEQFTIITGRVAYQVKGEPVKYGGEGETMLFKRGTPHRFWNDGQDVLHCKCWVEPSNTFAFFLSAVFAAQNKSGKAQPEQFDGAYLLTRYSSEYKMNGIPAFVRKVVIPITYFIGKIFGKYRHFKDAPAPMKNGNPRKGPGQ